MSSSHVVHVPSTGGRRPNSRPASGPGIVASYEQGAEADSGRPFAVPTRSALDPSVSAVAWSVHRLHGVNHRHSSDSSVAAARSVFRLLAEQLHLPGLGSVAVQVVHDPSRPDDAHVHLAIGVFGRTGGLDDEVASVTQLVDAQIGRHGLPFDFRRSTFELMLDAIGAIEHTVIVRQRNVELDDGQGGDLRVLMRFNPTTDPWVPLLRLIANHPHRIGVRVTALPTEITVADRAELATTIRRAERSHAELTDQAELVTPARRALVTAGDVASSFTSPIFCGEIAIVSDAPIPERLARAIATCFTSDTEVVRRQHGTVVAGQAVMLGGFELERNTDRLAEALELGVPLRGGLVERELRDLWTLTETPIGWPVPVGETVPGLRSASRRVLPAPSALAADPVAGGMQLGHDHHGASVWIDDIASRRHVAIWGRTGSGKTALLVAAMQRDLEQQHSFLFVDPHSDAGRRVSAAASASGRSVTTVEVDAENSAVVWWAPRLCADGANLPQVSAAVRSFIEASVSHLPEDWAGPRFMQGASAILIAACSLGCDIRTAIELIGSPAGTEELCLGPALPEWVGDYLEGLHSRTHTDSASLREWITSKFTALFSGPARQLFGKPGEGADLGGLVVAGDPVVVNLAGLAEGDARLVGHVVLSQVTTSIMARGVVAPDAAPIRIYVDEAPRFHSHNIELLITGGRKFGASLVLAAQAPNQFDGVVGDQALAAETHVAFAQTPGGARMLSTVFDLPASELVGQPDFHAYVKSGRHPICSIDTPRYLDE